MAQAIGKKNALDLFIEGAKQGWNISTGSMLPNVLMAFVLIQILSVTHLLDLIGKLAAPVMALWGLPGEALVVLCAAFMSMGGAAAVAASLVSAGKLTGVDATVLAPAVMLMGSLIQYLGRCLGTADANRKYWGWHIVISVINGCIAMWLMRLFMLFI
ncbi:MAG: YjiG family protein [Deltaproteobacteria bacterium]|jgi:spore maturation protein SpmB|nr:YjiG family protein [Deltaproteobacteria bacterium]